MNPWPFNEPRNCATFTTRQVMYGPEPILLVCHEASDHCWQFIGTSPGSLENTMLVALEEVVLLDPTVMEVADLPPGWYALRTEDGGAWTRRPQPADPRDEE